MTYSKIAADLEALADQADFSLLPKAPKTAAPKAFDKVAALETFKDLGIDLSEEDLKAPEALRIVEKIAATRTPPTPLGEPSDRPGTDYAAPRNLQEAYKLADRQFEDMILGSKD